MNPEAQTKLREEVVSVLGSDSVVTPAHIQDMSFMKDCIKESLRYLFAFIALNLIQIKVHNKLCCVRWFIGNSVYAIH